jgi:hypothetical protein
MTKFCSLSLAGALQLICVAGRCEIYLVLNGGAREFNCLALHPKYYRAREEDEGCASSICCLGGRKLLSGGGAKIKTAQDKFHAERLENLPL